MNWRPHLHHTYVSHLNVVILSPQLRLKQMKRYKEALCDKVQESSQATCWKCCFEINPNHNTIASPRQCILLILLSAKSDVIMLWWLKSGTEPDMPKKWLRFGNGRAAFVLSQQCLKISQTASRWRLSRTGCWRKYYHVSFVENICSCVALQDCGHVSKEICKLEVCITQRCSKIFTHKFQHPT